MSRRLVPGRVIERLSAMECAAHGGAVADPGHPWQARRRAPPKRRPSRRSPQQPPRLAY
jgi:hypothetical protein